MEVWGVPSFLVVGYTGALCSIAQLANGGGGGVCGMVW